MARVPTSTDYVEVEGDYGSVEGVEVTCSRCGHSEQSAGTHDSSIGRCAALLRENCPRGEKYFYLNDRAPGSFSGDLTGPALPSLPCHHGPRPPDTSGVIPTLPVTSKRSTFRRYVRF